MQKYKYWIPSSLTLINLSLGVLAILINLPLYSLILIFIATIFDVFDGIVARALKAQSEFGKQLDSLADLVTFGVAPAFLMFQHCFAEESTIRFVVILIPIFSAIRLAKFNIDDSQKTNFRGLPTPANGLFFASFPVIISIHRWAISEIFFIGIILLFSFLLVSPIRMFAFKNIKKGGLDTFFPLIFLILLLLLSFFLSTLTIPIGVLLYVLMSIVYNILLKFKNQNSTIK